MNRILVIISVLLLFVCFPFPSAAQTPFTSHEKSQEVSHSPNVFHLLLIKISTLQKKLNQRLAHLTKAFKKSEKLSTLLLLIIVAFIYGVVHAAGPGHGKVITASYMISRDKGLGECILFGNIIAFVHGLFGVLLVFIVHFIIQRTMADTTMGVTYITQIVSYSLITLLGIILLVKKFKSRYHSTTIEEVQVTGSSWRKQKSVLATALMIGMVPCPGIILIMLFALSFQVIWLGFLLVIAMTIGMAVTISLVAIIGTSGKTWVIKTLNNKNNSSAIIKHKIEVTAAFVILLMGVLFLTTTLYTGS
jgi:ABC-type nickel/cobalt efflux system permease component RcnA